MGCQLTLLLDRAIARLFSFWDLESEAWRPGLQQGHSKVCGRLTRVLRGAVTLLSVFARACPWPLFLRACPWPRFVRGACGARTTANTLLPARCGSSETGSRALAAFSPYLLWRKPCLSRVPQGVLARPTPTTASPERALQNNVAAPRGSRCLRFAVNRSR